MTERVIRGIAGTFVLASVTLGYWFSPYFYLFTAFVGANLLQSAFTQWCPMVTFLRWAGVGSSKDPSANNLVTPAGGAL